MTIVVKIGGARGNSLTRVIADLVPRQDYVVVHGGSEEVDRLGDLMGRPSRYYTSPSGTLSRYTDPARLEVVIMALAGTVQTEIVRSFAARGVGAVGLSGADGGLLVGRRKEGSRAAEDGRVVHLRDDRSGAVERVKTELLHQLLGAGWVPVVGPPAITPEGELLNVDADRAAAQVAAALGAEALVLLTNVPGLLRDLADPGSRVPSVDRDEIDAVLPLARGRMRKKVLAAAEAVRGGVGRAIIASSATDLPVARALAGEGTVFR